MIHCEWHEAELQVFVSSITSLEEMREKKKIISQHKEHSNEEEKKISLRRAEEPYVYQCSKTEQSGKEAERADKTAQHVQLPSECTVQEKEKIK